MARVPVSEGRRVGLQPLSGQTLRPADFGSAGEGIGQAAVRAGSAVAEFADYQDKLAAIHDEAAVKDVTTGITTGFLEDGYTSDSAFFKQQGKNALEARPGFEEKLNARIGTAREALTNERQRHMFDRSMAPQRNSWSVQIAAHSDKETLRYGSDQATARRDLALTSAAQMLLVDREEGEKQLQTAFGEIDQFAKLNGWSEDQVLSAKRDATSKVYVTATAQKSVASATDAWRFAEENRSRIDPAKFAELENTLRPRVLRDMGLALADQLGGKVDPSLGGKTDPLAPLPEGHADPETVWTRMVGPGGHGGVEGGTNADGTFRTSPKGAIGPAQVMPGTAPEAARLAGLPYDEHRYKTDFAYNLALGKAYYRKQLSDFGDPVLAAAAYNAGPGRVRSALAKDAENWTAHIPAETRKYVEAVSGGASAGTSGASGGSSPKTALAYQLKALDAMDVPYEAKEAARTVLTQRANQDSALAQEEHQNWLNDFLVSLHDGNSGRGDIAAARKSGKLNDYDEITRAEGIIDQREKDGADLTNFGRMMGDPHFVFNQYDDTQRKAVEAGVKAQGGTPEAAFQVWQRTGILAKSGSIALRGSLVSTDAKRIQVAANIAGNMLRLNPNAFAGVDGGSDIEHAAVSFNHYVYDLGFSPQQSANRVAQENDPKFKEKAKYTDPQRQEAFKTLRQGVFAENVFSGSTFPNPEKKAEGNQTYHELIVDQLGKGLDLAAAQAQAAVQLRKVYGVNKQGRIVKYAPEAAYPAIGGSYDYIYDDAGRTVKAETGRDPVSVDLLPIPGVTDEDFRAGRTPRYQVIYSYISHGQKVIDTVPGQFAADTVEPAKALSTQRRRSFAQERRFRTNVDRNFDNATVLPGIGPVR